MKKHTHMPADGPFNGAVPARQDILLSVTEAFAPYLQEVVQKTPPAQHERVQAMFAQHMAFLADVCLRYCSDNESMNVAFILALHKAMYPPDHRQPIRSADGEVFWMVPGAVKTFVNGSDSRVHPGRVNLFTPPEQVEPALNEAVRQLNAALSAAVGPHRRLDAILSFVQRFLFIHPFADANGRVACILADLLALQAGLPAFHFHGIKSADLPRLYAALESADQTGSLQSLHAVLADAGWFRQAGISPQAQ